VSQPHTLRLDSTATWFATVPLVFARTSSHAGTRDQRRGCPPWRGRAHGRDLSCDRRVPSDSCDRGHVIASNCIHARIPFVWFATRRALLGGD